MHKSFPTAAAALIFYTQAELSTSAQSQSDFANLLAMNYHSLVPDKAKSIKGLKDTINLSGDELRRAHSSNEKLLQRYVDGTVNIPLELLHPWVESLDEYRDDAVNAILRMGDYLPMRIARGGVMQKVSSVSHEFGDFLSGIAPVIEDNVIDTKDLPFLPAAIIETRSLIAALGSLLHSMEAIADSGQLAANSRQKNKTVPIERANMRRCKPNLGTVDMGHRT